MKIDEYAEGYLRALEDFAIWKEGSRTVGCGVYSLDGAAQRFLRGRFPRATDEEVKEALISRGLCRK